MKSVKLFLFVFWFVGTCNVYGMKGTAPAGEAPAKKEAPKNEAKRPAVSEAEFAELKQFEVRSPEFIDVLHRWAFNARFDLLHAAFISYESLRYAQCNNRSGQTLLDSANKAPDNLKNKKLCIKSLTVHKKIDDDDNTGSDNSDNVVDYEGDDTDDDDDDDGFYSAVFDGIFSTNDDEDDSDGYCSAVLDGFCSIA